MPTFLVHDEFFVLSFENVGEDEEFGLKASRLKRRKSERCKKQCKAREIIMPEEMDKENQDPNERINQKPIQKVVNDSEILRPMNNSNRNAQIATEENSNGRKKRREKEENVGPAAMKVETECNLENSSPISVLEYGESIVDRHKDPTSDKANSRTNLSAELDHYGHSPPHKTSSSTGDVQKRKTINGKCHGSKKKDCRRQNYVDLWGEICEMAEGDMVESNWVYRELWEIEDFQDIGVECGLQILEILLHELVDQVAQTYHKIF